MSDQSPEYGYHFYPDDSPEEIGHPRLDILLRRQPTETHFDPEIAHFFAFNPTIGMERVAVSHPWEGGICDYHILPSRISMQDRKGKVVEAFTFGGQLEITSHDDYTRASITSNAPILDLSTGRNVSSMVAQEVEVLLAERRGQYLDDVDVFYDKLAHTDPFILFHACLEALRERYKHLPMFEDGLSVSLVHYLSDENRNALILRRLPENPKKLEEIV